MSTITSPVPSTGAGALLDCERGSEGFQTATFLVIFHLKDG